MVDSAILGIDVKCAVVGGKMYKISPPTIRTLAGAGYHLAEFGGIEKVGDVFASLKDLGSAAKALSWFIAGDESLAGELSQGTLPEVVEALEAAFSLVSVENFSRLSVLTRSVSRLTARQLCYCK